LSLRAGSGLWRLVHYILIFFAALAVAMVAARLGVPSDLAAVGSMLLALLAICAVIEAQRYHPRIRLAGMDEDEHRRIARHEPEVRYSRPLWRGKSYIVTTLVGQLVVNGPVVPLFIAPVFLVQRWFDPGEYPIASLLALPTGFPLAWAWWSVSVSVWRWWALRYRGMAPDELQWRGEAGNLLWPEHSRAARTALYAWRGVKRRRSK